MVRSQWMGPLFGVVALTGLAAGQTTSPAPAAGAARDHFVTLQEPGKPAQRCKVLKLWTEADGVRAFQLQALDTGELMTLEESDPTAPPPGTLVRSAAMRIFHWGRGNAVPLGAPEPPPNAVVVGYAIDIHPPAADSPRVAAVPVPAPSPVAGKWPSAFAVVNAADRNPTPPPPLAPSRIAPLAPAPVASKAQLTPLPSNAVAAAPVVTAPVKPSPYRPAVTVWSKYGSKATANPVVAANESPYATKAVASVKTPNAAPAVSASESPYAPVSSAPVKRPDEKPALTPTAVSWVAKTAEVKAVAPAVKPGPLVAAKPPPTGPFAPEVKPMPLPVVARQPGHPAPKAPASAPDLVIAPKVVTATPSQPSDWRQSWGKLDAPPAPVAPSPKVELPHAAPKVDDPLRTPDKYTRLPGDFFPPDKPAAEHKTPSVAALAQASPPATADLDGKEKAAAPLNPPALPPLPGPTGLFAPAPKPSALAPAEKPAVAATKPTEQPAAPATKPAAPLGMASVAAAASPELAPPAPTAPRPASAAEQAAMGISANGPNAFSGGTRTGEVAAAPNAFTPPAPAADPQRDALAVNAFAPQPSAAPTVPPSAVAVRTPAAGPAAPQMATGYVVPAGYRQDSGYTASQLASILRESLYPSQREWAAETLASMDWHSQPLIVDVLVERAKQDPAPMVRAECLHSLAQMKPDSAAAVEAVKALRSDSDDRVRQAAVDALADMTGPAPSH